jgi:hypothetical protein
MGVSGGQLATIGGLVAGRCVARVTSSGVKVGKMGKISRTSGTALIVGKKCAGVVNKVIAPNSALVIAALLMTAKERSGRNLSIFVTRSSIGLGPLG